MGDAAESNLNQTPSANRTHIGFFGRMNAGKSSLINAFTGQTVSIVSDTAGTTTDVVRKPMEIHGIGPCVLLDTAGFDDEGELGRLRTAAAEKAAERCDAAVLLVTAETLEMLNTSGDNSEELSFERKWIDYFKKRGIPVIGVLSKADLSKTGLQKTDLPETDIFPLIPVSARTGEGVEALREALIQCLSERRKKRYITGNLVKAGDSVLLVMPQDIQAPEGRLILPQVQTIRELLDRNCVVTCVTADGLEEALASLKKPPALIITDSQVFGEVYAKKPEESRLTSFSVLFAGWKGDIRYYAESASVMDRLTEHSRVLIAECCTHAPLEEDIGRVKIPRLLRQRTGPGLQVDLTAGADFPEDLSGYDLIIQCGACMFNRNHVTARIGRAKEAGVPMTNYGIAIAHLKGILDKVELVAED